MDVSGKLVIGIFFLAGALEAVNTAAGVGVTARCKQETDCSSGDQCILDASQPGSWHNDGLCLFANMSTKTEHDFYVVSADIKNIDSRAGINSGHVGIAYNLKDETNFDYVFVRFHRPDCMLGKVVNGLVTITRTVANPQKPQGGTWINVTIDVKSTQATIYVDGMFIVTTSPHFPSKDSYAGVITANGFENIAAFRNLRIRTSFNCADRNPCTQANRDAGNFYFPNDDVTKFVQCSAHPGQCWVMPCASGTEWNQEINTCDWPKN